MAAAVLLAAQGTLKANGFYIPVQDSFATSRGNAFVATADRPSAIYYNPAGLTQLDSVSTHMGLYAVRLGIEADTDFDGGSYENDAEFIPLPQLYVAAPINDRLRPGSASMRPLACGRIGAQRPSGRWLPRLSSCISPVGACWPTSSATVFRWVVGSG